MSEIEKIVRKFLPHRDEVYIPGLVVALQIYCRDIENKSFKDGQDKGENNENI